MNDRTGSGSHEWSSLRTRAVKYRRDFWVQENLNFSTPHFRMRKVGRLLRRLSHGRECDLLDVGCGPGTLGTLLPPNIHYFGIDIAIPVPARNFLEMDILDTPIGFHGRRFDFVVAQGILEYVSNHQSEKFAEIAKILNPDGKFVLTYTNFDHWKPEIYFAHSNVQRLADFRADLGRFFRIERSFLASYNWRHSIPKRRRLMLAQAYLNANLPVISPTLAVDYLYICSPLPPAPTDALRQSGRLLYKWSFYELRPPAITKNSLQPIGTQLMQDRDLAP